MVLFLELTRHRKAADSTDMTDEKIIVNLGDIQSIRPREHGGAHLIGSRSEWYVRESYEHIKEKLDGMNRLQLLGTASQRHECLAQASIN